MNTAYWLPVIWAGLLGFAVLAYVVLDGFGLGVGILFAAEPDYEDRSLMVNSIAPVWDGNQTWLVLGGGGLLAVFPVAYGLVMSAQYPTIVLMLLALIFRGVAFEFRFRAETVRGRWWWDVSFWGGSTVAAFAQGLTLGGLLHGVSQHNGIYNGGWWDWLNTFTLLCGLSVVIGYGLLGACWIIWRTSGAMQRRARRYAAFLGTMTLALIGIVSFWSPFLHPHFFERWFSFPNIVLLSPIPLLVGVLAIFFYRALGRDSSLTPFLCAIGWFVLCLAGLGISLYPYIVPQSITIWQAAAPPASQEFLLAGAVFLVPAILGYTFYSYWVFRGKISQETHYH